MPRLRSAWKSPRGHMCLPRHRLLTATRTKTSYRSYSQLLDQKRFAINSLPSFRWDPELSPAWGTNPQPPHTSCTPADPRSP